MYASPKWRFLQLEFLEIEVVAKEIKECNNAKFLLESRNLSLIHRISETFFG